MGLRFATTLQPPFAVYDDECAVVGFDPDDVDKPTQREVDLQRSSGEYVCTYLPKDIYVKIDGCEHQFLLPALCAVLRLTGRNRSYLNRISV